MNTENWDNLLDQFENSYGERARRGSNVRAPTRQSSFTPKSTGAASEGQVHAATRNLDSKIEMLSNSLKTLETRVNGVEAESARTALSLRKESEERKKSSDGLKRELQNVRMMSFLIPMMTQKTVNAPDGAGNQLKVVTQKDDSMSTILPLMMVMAPQGEGNSGGFGDPMTMMMMVVALSNRN